MKPAVLAASLLAAVTAATATADAAIDGGGTARAFEPAFPLRISLDKTVNYDGDNKVKLLQAMDVMEAVLNSHEFREAVLGFTYGGALRFANNERFNGKGRVIDRDLTNAQVYRMIVEGAEQLKGIDARVDHTANLHLELYNVRGTVGYVNPGYPEIYTNWYYFDEFTPANVAEHISHEWTHVLGFRHDGKNTARRPYSVSYAVGCLVEKIALGLDPKACHQKP